MRKNELKISINIQHAESTGIGEHIQLQEKVMAPTWNYHPNGDMWWKEHHDLEFLEKIRSHFKINLFRKPGHCKQCHSFFFPLYLWYYYCRSSGALKAREVDLWLYDCWFKDWSCKINLSGAREKTMFVYSNISGIIILLSFNLILSNLTRNRTIIFCLPHYVRGCNVFCEYKRWTKTLTTRKRTIRNSHEWKP